MKGKVKIENERAFCRLFLDTILYSFETSILLYFLFLWKKTKIFLLKKISKSFRCFFFRQNEWIRGECWLFFREVFFLQKNFEEGKKKKQNEQKNVEQYGRKKKNVEEIRTLQKKTEENGSIRIGEKVFHPESFWQRFKRKTHSNTPSLVFCFSITKMYFRKKCFSKTRRRIVGERRFFCVLIFLCED